MEEHRPEEECGDIWPTGDNTSSHLPAASAKGSVHFSFAGRLNFPSKTVELLGTDCSPQTVRDKSERPLGENTAGAALPKFPDLHLPQTMGDQSTVVCSRIYHQNLAGWSPLLPRNFCIFAANDDTSRRFSDKSVECKQGDSYSFKTAPGCYPASPPPALFDQ